VIIVLAGGIRKDGTLVNNIKNRVRVAAKLWKQKKAPRILMCGKWTRGWEPTSHKTEAAAMADFARTLGVPAIALLKEEESSTTEGNVLSAQKLYLIPQKWRKVIVVTAGYHMNRSRFLFTRMLGKTYMLKFVSAPYAGSLRWRVLTYLREKIKLFIAMYVFRT
jgi:uncharacterized SAM-binding protein YcdF (DUF218 family)